MTRKGEGIVKRFISVLLCIILVFLSGCSTPKTPEEIYDSLLEEYINNIDEFETPVREFGTTVSYIHMDKKISVGILYPETEYEFLNKKITKWVENLVEEYIEELEGKEDETAELTVLYESHLVGASTVSIKMKGTYFSSYMAHPIDIIKTFNADIKKKEFLEIRDIIKKKSYDKFTEMVALSADVDRDLIDEHFLDNAIITKDGIEIVLSRGDYLPMSDGTKIVSFKYGEIANLLSDSFDYKNLKTEVEENDVQIKENEDKQTIDPDKPMIALTFDDGPSVHTERLLDIFKKFGGKGTFFVVGNLLDGRKNTLIRIANEGHEIGNHSWSHRQLTNLTDEEIKDQIMMTRAIIYDITGKDCLIVRPPYGACNDDVKAVGKTLGVSFVNWSVDTLDWKTKNADAVYNEIINNASDGAIILCHDLHKTTVDSMETVIPKLIADGYQLVTVSQLMEYSDKQLEPGKVYYRQ